MRNLKPAEKNGGESSKPILIPSQVEPQIRHKMANKKEGRKLLVLAEEEVIRFYLFENMKVEPSLVQMLKGSKAQKIKHSLSGFPGGC
jgi:hypothetical protein